MAAVDVEEMETERSEAESTLLADGELAYKLDGGCAAQASECEERQRFRAEEVVDTRGNIKLLNDDDSVEVLKVTLPSTQGSAFTGAIKNRHCHFGHICSRCQDIKGQFRIATEHMLIWIETMLSKHNVSR